MNKTLLFPICVFDFNWAEYSKYKDDLVDYCHELENIPTPLAVAPGAKRNLFESKFNFLQSDRESVVALSDFFYNALWEVAKDMNGRMWEVANKKLLIHESWCHVTKTGGYHDIHRHPGCSWCGIFYLEPAQSNLSTRNGVNRFYNDVINLGADEGTLYMESYYDSDPVPGKLIIFPSHMAHSALTYMGDTPRIVIAFNAQVRSAND